MKSNSPRLGVSAVKVLPLCAVVFRLLAMPAAAETIRGHVVTPGGEAVADAVVFVRELPNGVVVEPPAATAVMDQVNKEFVPHILPVVVGTAVNFPNHDQIHHHVYSFSRTKMFEIPLYKGEAAPPVVFDSEGAVKIGCNIHDWMSAVILVLPNALFAKTGPDGAFAIDLPSGRYPLAVWHERSKVSVDDTVREIDAGGAGGIEFKIEISPPRPRSGAHGLRKYE